MIIVICAICAKPLGLCKPQHARRAMLTLA